MGSLSAPANGEALPMNPDVKQGYRLHSALSNLNRLDVGRLDDADKERVETARNLLEEVNQRTRSDDGDGTNA
jgi:hypothetical protein